MRNERPQTGRTLDLIRSKSFEGRKALIAELRREKTDESVSLLVEILADESWSLRELAVSALVEAPDLATPRLMTLLDRGLWYTRAAAARALGILAHGPALPRILKLLGDSNQAIATEAARALVEMARRGRAVAVAQGVLSLSDEAEAGFRSLERFDPDSGRKIRILAARPEVSASIGKWLAEDGPDPEVLDDQLSRELDSELGVRWEDIAGPVGG